MEGFENRPPAELVEKKVMVMSGRLNDPMDSESGFVVATNDYEKVLDGWPVRVIVPLDMEKETVLEILKGVLPEVIPRVERAYDFWKEEPVERGA